MVTSSTSRAVKTGHAIALGLLILSVAFTGLMLVSISMGVFRHGNSLLYGEPLSVPLQISAEDLGTLPGGVTLDSWLAVDVGIPEPTTSDMLWRSAMDVGPTLVVVWALWFLVSIMGSAARGEPFGTDNARRLRSLGVLLIVGGFVLSLLNYAMLNALYSRVPEYPSIHLAAGPFSPFPGGMLVGGLVAFALAAVFADGSRLREDVEGTI
jgi:hypothetical protein